MIRQDRVVKTFIELAKIDSVSGEEETLAKYLVKKLKNLGGNAFLDNYGNVIGKFEGIGEAYIINSHLDTVEPGRGIKPQIKGNKIVGSGTTIVGGDAKAGIAIILEALEAIISTKKQHIPIEVVFTKGEETGLFGAVNLDYSKISAKKGITFDGEASVSNITIAAPGYNEIDLTITGRAAHAGAEPEKGISAIKIASEIISKLKVGRIDFETTANIGQISGGTARNAVPETVTISAEIRSRNLKKLIKHTEHFTKTRDKVMTKYPDATIDTHIYRQFDAYRFKDTHPVVERIFKVFKEMKIKPNLRESGGGTDVNIFHTHGIEAICVGIAIYNAHTTREYVDIKEMTESALFLSKFLQA